MNVTICLQMAAMIVALSQSVWAEPSPAAQGEANCVVEVSLFSEKTYANPFL